MVANGDVGLVPRKYVVDEEERAAMQQQQADAAAKIKRYQAVKPFKGRPGWPSFDYRDIILVPKQSDGDVWQGVCNS